MVRSLNSCMVVGSLRHMLSAKGLDPRVMAIYYMTTYCVRFLIFSAIFAEPVDKRLQRLISLLSNIEEEQGCH